MSKVMDGRNGTFQVYTLDPVDSVIAAYAQSLKDFNTWDYRGKYFDALVWGTNTVACGDFIALLNWEDKYRR